MFMMLVQMARPTISIGIVISENWSIGIPPDACVVRVAGGAHLIAHVQFEDFVNIQIHPAGAVQATKEPECISARYGKRQRILFDKMFKIPEAGSMNAQVVVEGIPAVAITWQRPQPVLTTGSPEATHRLRRSPKSFPLRWTL